MAPPGSPASAATPRSRKPSKQEWHATLVATILEFWLTHGIDRTPRERQLFRFVRARHGVRVNTYNVALILRRLVQRGVLARDMMIGRAIEYRLRRSYAFPLWPGYARDAEEFVAGAWVHAWADGTYSILGRGPDGSRVDVPILGADHFFSEFVRYRGYVHGRMRGLDAAHGDHERLLEEGIACGSVGALRALVADAARHHEFSAALQVIDQSRFCRALADLQFSSERPQETTEILGGADLGRHADVAIGYLHALCGHRHLLKAPAPRLGDVPPTLVFRALDAAVTTEIDRRVAALPAAQRRALDARRQMIGSPPNVDQWARDAHAPLVARAGQISWPTTTASLARQPRQVSVPSRPILSSHAHSVTRISTGLNLEV